jgi:hypothetical protein
MGREIRLVLSHFCKPNVLRCTKGLMFICRGVAKEIVRFLVKLAIETL